MVHMAEVREGREKAGERPLWAHLSCFRARLLALRAGSAEQMYVPVGERYENLDLL